MYRPGGELFRATAQATEVSPLGAVRTGHQSRRTFSALPQHFNLR